MRHVLAALASVIAVSGFAGSAGADLWEEEKARFLAKRGQSAPPAVRRSGGVLADDFLKRNVKLATQPPSSFIGAAKIGIRWDCKTCDVDLYARVESDEWLSFRNKKTPDGTYHKDFLRAPGAAAMESIDLVPGDVRKIKARVKLFLPKAGKAANGELRVFVDGHVYAMPFRVSHAAPEVTFDVAAMVLGTKKPKVETASWERAVIGGIISETNKRRAAHGLPALVGSPGLHRAAHGYAKFLTDGELWGRTTKQAHEMDGRTAAERVDAAGYRWRSVRENLYCVGGCLPEWRKKRFAPPGRDPKDIAQSYVQGWMDSPGHRANILAEDVSEIGVGVTFSADGRMSVGVQVFAKPL